MRELLFMRAPVHLDTRELDDVIVPSRRRIMRIHKRPSSDGRTVRHRCLNFEFGQNVKQKAQDLECEHTIYDSLPNQAEGAF